MLDYTFLYCANPDDREPIMDINQSIGCDEFGQGVDGTIFARELTMLSAMGKDKINIYINSHGGSVKDGFTIFTAILRCKTPTCGYVGGVAASIAGVILQACDWRVLYSFSHYMIHNPAFAGEDTTVDEDPILQLIKTSLMDMLKTTKLSNSALDKLMNAETWMDPTEALKNGFIDEIIDINAEIETINLEYIVNNKSEIKSIVSKYNLIENSLKDNIKNKNKQNNMIDKLKKILNLADTATDKEVENAAKKEFPFLFTLNERSVSQNPPGYSKLKNEDPMNEKEEDCMNDDDMEVVDGETLPTEMVDYKDKDVVYNKMKKEIANLRKEVSDLRNTKSTELVNLAISQGKIKESESKVWLNLAKKDYTSTEVILNSIGVTKVSDSLVNVIDREKSAKFLAEEKSRLEAENKEKIETVINTNKSWDSVDFNKAFKLINSKK